MGAIDPVVGSEAKELLDLFDLPRGDGPKVLFPAFFNQGAARNLKIPGGSLDNCAREKDNVGRVVGLQQLPGGVAPQDFEPRCWRRFIHQADGPANVCRAHSRGVIMEEHRVGIWEFSKADGQ